MKAAMITFLLLCTAITGSAQEFFASAAPDTTIKAPRSEVATQIAVGAANILDTYLSYEKYRGAELRFISSVARDSKGSVPLTYLWTHEGEVGYTKQRAKDGGMLTAHYDFSFGTAYRWRLLDERLTLRAGAMADLRLGVTYNDHALANNPAQADFSLDLGAVLAAQYRFRLCRLPMRVEYSVRMPFVGMLFAPEYGESYYEMFVRDDISGGKNIVFTSLAVFQMRQQLALDMQLGRRAALRLGYICDIRQAKPNNLKQHHYFNALTLGVVVRK